MRVARIFDSSNNIYGGVYDMAILLFGVYHNMKRKYTRREKEILAGWHGESAA